MRVYKLNILKDPHTAFRKQLEEVTYVSVLAIRKICMEQPHPKRREFEFNTKNPIDNLKKMFEPEVEGAP